MPTKITVKSYDPPEIEFDNEISNVFIIELPAENISARSPILDMINTFALASLPTEVRIELSEPTSAHEMSEHVQSILPQLREFAMTRKQIIQNVIDNDPQTNEKMALQALFNYLSPR